MTKGKVKQLVAAVAVAGTIGAGYAVNVITDMQKQITTLQENAAELSKDNINLVVERDNLKQLTEVQKKELEKLQGKLEENVNPVSETVSTEEVTTEEPKATSVAFESGNYLGYFEATMYNDSGCASDGTPVYDGMVAADWSVLPPGTQVYVEFPEPYGYLSKVYRVHDQGGAVTGNVLDVWVPWSEDEMLQFGRRDVHVYIV